MNTIQPTAQISIFRDDAFDFGLGLFETIAVENQRLIFPEKHLERIRHSMEQLGISHPQAEQKLCAGYLAQLADQCPPGRYALKVSLSAQNLLFTIRPGGYSPADYRKGFRLKTSSIFRNETSPFTYHKTMNCGENILEKRRARIRNFEEPLFLNTKGYLTEGATTNLFLLREGQLYTPCAESGILPGVLRAYLIETEPVIQTFLSPQELPLFEEAFVTNSLLGIMPVVSIDGQAFPQHEKTLELLHAYETYTGACLL